LKDAGDFYFLCLAVEKAVKKYGGGFDVPWSGPGFIKVVEEKYHELKHPFQTSDDFVPNQFKSAQKSNWDFRSTTGWETIKEAVHTSRKRYIGSWMIGMYLRVAQAQGDYRNRLEDLYNNKTKLEEIASGRAEHKREKWTEFLKTAPQKLWQGVEDPFIPFKWFRGKISPLLRRQLRYIDEVPICGNPALSAVKRQLKDMAIGQWNLDKDKSGLFEYQGAGPLPQLMEKFREGHYPIGRIFLTKATADGDVTGKEGPYLGRYIDLRIALAYLLSIALNNNLLKTRGMEQELHFGIWVDGTHIGGHPVLVILAFFIWKPEYSSTSEEKWSNALRFSPVSLVVLPENQRNISDMVAFVRKQAQQLEPLIYKGVTYNFRFRVLSGDHAAQQKVMGNATGSAWSRCEQCNAKFNEFDKLWRYDYLAACTHKTLNDVVQQWLSGKAGENGLTNISPLLGTDLEDLKNLPQRDLKWIKKFVLALDSLHNIKGHLATIVKRLQKESGWNEDEFKELLEKHVQRRNVADLDGQHYRLLFALWKQVILPTLQTTDPARLDKLQTLFHHWEEIQWIHALTPRGPKQ
jgi:hypothetical protein